MSKLNITIIKHYSYQQCKCYYLSKKFFCTSLIFCTLLEQFRQANYFFGFASILGKYPNYTKQKITGIRYAWNVLYLEYLNIGPEDKWIDPSRTDQLLTDVKVGYL